MQGSDAQPILPLTKANLLPLLAGDPKAIALAEKGKLDKALLLYNRNRREELLKAKKQ